MNELTDSWHSSLVPSEGNEANEIETVINTVCENVTLSVDNLEENLLQQFAHY